LKTSSISGTAIAGSIAVDIKQPAGTIYAIQLCNTELVNATADINGFTTGVESNQIFFTLGSQVNYTGSGSVASTPIGTYYIIPGILPANFANVTVGGVVGIPFPHKTIIYEGIASSTKTLGSSVVTIRLYYSSSATVLGTSFATMIINSTNINATFTTATCYTFIPLTSYLQVQCVITGAALTAGTNIIVGLSTY